MCSWKIEVFEKSNQRGVSKELYLAERIEHLNRLTN